MHKKFCFSVWEVLVLIAMLALMALLATPTRASDGPLFRSGELSIDTFGTTRSAKAVDTQRIGAGIGVTYFTTRNVGVAIDATSENTQHSFFDATHVSGVVRFPSGRFAPYVVAGTGWRFEERELDLHAGVGAEVRLIRNLGIFGDYRWTTQLDRPWSESQGIARAGLRFTF